MNRIILIGNGFDLAHGIPTSYNSFMNDYWERIIKNVSQTRPYSTYNSDLFKINKVPKNWLFNPDYESFKNSILSIGSTITFSNIFFEIISEKLFIENWVDIENEYYSLLKKSYSEKGEIFVNGNTISKLNADFKIIKNELRDYLFRVQENFNNKPPPIAFHLKNIIGHKIYSYFKLKDFTEEAINKRVEIEYKKIEKDIIALKEGKISLDELSSNDIEILNKIGNSTPKKKLKKILLDQNPSHLFDLVPKETLLLNFNYTTATESLYKHQKDFENFESHESTNVQSIHIHGTLNHYDKNPIVFGFGDELDNEYKTIEDLNNNEYLENIKSIKYSETDNYKKLIELINSDSYQVFIFGHSCGISDRTLLNTLFEHDNCVSIKPYYHQINEDQDNYSDIVRNISRNFNDKTKMRDRVVNKTYCEPLSK